MKKKKINFIYRIFIFLLLFMPSFRSSSIDVRACSDCPSDGRSAMFCNVGIVDNLCVGKDVQINGNLTVCGTINPQTNSNYVFSFLSVQLPFTQPSFWTDVAFNSNGPMNGWSHELGSPEFICNVSGIYFITYDAITQSEGTSVVISVELAVAVNGVRLPESSTVTTHPTTDQLQSASRSFLKQLQAGDDLRVQLRYMPNGRADLMPPTEEGSSIALTILRVG